MRQPHASWTGIGRRRPAALLGALCAAALLASGAAPEGSPPPEPTPEESIRTLIDEGRYGEAAAAARELLAATEAGHGEDSAETAAVLDLLTESLWRGGKARSDETLAAAERAVRIKEGALGAGHPEVAASRNHLGQVHRKRGRYDAARAEFERALAIQDAALPRDDPERARTLNNLGMIHRATGELEAAVPLYEEALEIRRKAFGDDHIRVAETRNNLANVLRVEGRTEEARKLLEQVLETLQKELGPEHPKVATVMNNLALLLLDVADFGGAQQLFTRSLEIRRRALGPDHFDVTQSLNNLAILLWRTGDAEGARRAYEEALEIRERTLGPDHIGVAMVQHNLAFLLARMGDLDGGQAMIDRALAIREKVLGPDHVHIADSLNTVAEIQRVRGEYEQAIASIERALSIQRAAFGEPHHLIGMSLWNLGATYRAAGDLKKARETFEKTLEMWRQTLGPDHPRLAEVLDDLAGLQWLQGEQAQALERALEAERIGRAHVQRTARRQSEREALGYEAFRVGGRDVVLVALATGTRGGIPAPLLQRAWDELIRSRALVLDEIGARNRTLRGSHDPKTSALAKELERSRARLASLMARGPDRRRPEEYPGKLAEALRRTEEAERTLAAHSLKFRRERARKRVGRADVIGSLPPEGILVSYFLFQKIGPGSPRDADDGGEQARTRSYLALVQRPGEAAPTAVPLGPADPIDEMARAWQREIATPPPVLPAAARQAERRYREVGERLRRAIWDPVAGAVGDAPMVFIVPDAVLHVVSLATLPAPGQGYLAENGPRFHYLAAERDLMPRSLDRGGNTGVLALGGPDFDLGVVNTAARRGTGGCRDLSSLRFEPLPAAGREVEEVAALLSADGEPSHREEVRILTGAAADEAAFKRLAPGRRLLHLATHGFFLDDCASASSPLLRSGIGLAGANRLRGAPAPQEQEDGILSALEIASLDLTGVEWAVLSACETGLGEVQRGEGVLGLRRAFEVAGVRTLIMSLWSVQDEAAREWMTALYRGRREGLATVQAVRRASLERIQARREAGRVAHPFYWGAFVAVGDWR